MLIELAVGAAILWAAGYAVACRIWPFASCRRCGGAGKFQSPSGRYWRHCGRCKGSGSRVRTGRRVWDGLVSVRDKAAG